MAEFLDKDGLAHFWSKIQTTIDLVYDNVNSSLQSFAKKIDAKADKSYVDTIANETVTCKKLNTQLQTAVGQTITGVAVDNSSMEVIQKGKLVQVSIRIFLMGDLKVANSSATIALNFSDFGLPTGYQQTGIMHEQAIAKLINTQTESLEMEEVFTSYNKISFTGFKLLHSSDFDQLKLAKTITYIAE